MDRKNIMLGVVLILAGLYLKGMMGLGAVGIDPTFGAGARCSVDADCPSTAEYGSSTLGNPYCHASLDACVYQECVENCQACDDPTRLDNCPPGSSNGIGDECDGIEQGIYIHGCTSGDVLYDILECESGYWLWSSYYGGILQHCSSSQLCDSTYEGEKLTYTEFDQLCKSTTADCEQGSSRVAFIGCSSDKVFKYDAEICEGGVYVDNPIYDGFSSTPTYPCPDDRKCDARTRLEGYGNDDEQALQDLASKVCELKPATTTTQRPTTTTQKQSVTTTTQKGETTTTLKDVTTTTQKELETHNVCSVGGHCETVLGAGTDECTSSSQCSSDPEPQLTHMECNAGGKCVEILGAGTDSCNQDGQCVSPDCNGNDDCEFWEKCSEGECNTDMDIVGLLVIIGGMVTVVLTFVGVKVIK